MIADWDIPFDHYNNYADYDPSLNLICQEGSDNRFTGIAYLSDDSLFGAKAVRNDLHVWPTSNFETGDLYQFIASPGYYIEGSSYDLTSILTAKKIDLSPSDSINFDFALVSTRTSIDSLKASVQKARILAGMYIPGDPDGDRDVDVSDVIYLINYLFKSGPLPSPLLSGDADCNGDINVSDVIYLINFLFKGGPAPCS